MKVPESSLVEVVTEASSRMSDPSYANGQVERVMRAQPAIAQYVVAHQKELAVDGVVTVLFHTCLILDSVVKATGRRPTRVSYNDLDAAAQMVGNVEHLAKDEPALASYIASNVGTEEGATGVVAQTLLAQVAKALLIA
ncbi:MAG: hypothetical protein IT371_21260 [Deltaproteobacteria bacterium]|nr:hypothetical protein [Deltaproteobacteria bacterium]